MINVAVRQKRKRLGYSRTKFAALLNVRPEDVQAWEEGDIEVSGRTVQALMIMEHGYSGADVRRLLSDFGFPFEPTAHRRVVVAPALKAGGWRAA